MSAPLSWESGNHCFYSSCRRFFVAEVTHNGGTAWDAWELTKPQAMPIAGTPFDTADLAKAACQRLAPPENSFA